MAIRQTHLAHQTHLPHLGEVIFPTMPPVCP